MTRAKLGLLPLQVPCFRYSLVLREADFVSEGLVAQLAGERPLAVVRPPRVDLEAVRRGEDLLALHARVDVAQGKGPGCDGEGSGAFTLSVKPIGETDDSLNKII